ncbi:MAG TPA: class I SAM-dependent RNA methyltransferase, partial [Bacteroidia bacterium]|nr:class I SAM-dependent RNA methyltransferase [Bacteroidia bacterium]
KANLCLHTALKVVIPIAKFIANNEQELYDNIKLIEWEKFISNTDTLMVEGVANSEIFTHSLYVSQKVKDGIVDRFRDKTGRRPDVDLIHPSFRLYVHIFKNEVSLHLDSSGEPLYKRGYRSDINEAPMKEVLAAGLVKLSGWEKHLQLIDGMCGAGTIAIEAALWANNIPAGYFRNEFGFMRWSNFDEALYDTIHESSIQKIREDKVEIIANDIETATYKKAITNTKNAKVDDVVTCTNQSFFDITPTRGGGVIILNPPYGERLPVEEIEKLYKEIGNKLKKDFKGFNAWIITSNPEGVKSIGLRPSRRIHLFNGSLECRFLKFELYDGSKKASKNPDTMTKR